MIESKYDIRSILLSKEMLEVARFSVQSELVEFRDSRLSEPFRGNGLVIKEKNGKDSKIIRFGMERAMTIALKAIIEKIDGEETC